ncbi:hypothetical protein HYX14_03665 [Candidatus Woesearchaeota archaeon]|nr:hypothetical protein [Candidatus Woesearchaeota archaeon]
MNKITLLIHPFFYTRWFVCMQFNNEACYHGKTLRADLASEIASDFPLEPKKILDKYKQGVLWSRDGFLITYKARGFSPALDFERQLFDYIEETVPSHHVHHYIAPSDFREEDTDEDGRKVTDFLVQKYGYEAMREIELYAFGEDLAGCVAANAHRVQLRYQITKKPILLANFSSHSPDFTLDERITQVRRLYPEIDIR